MFDLNPIYWRGEADAEAIEHEHVLPTLSSASADFSLQDIASGRLGNLPKEILEAILVHGEADENNLTDRTFWKVHHPELTGKRLHPTSPAHARLRNEWAAVLRNKVRPVFWLRQVIDQLDKHRGSVARETLLGWMAVKSNGKVNQIGRGGERGYFQIDATTARTVLGLNASEFKKLSTDRVFSIRQGVELVARQQIAGDADKARTIGAQLKARADLVPPPAGAQPELEEESETRGKPVQVTNTFDVPFRWICKVSIRKNGKYVHGGTGLLISDRHVLTAAHVVYDVYQNRAQFDLEVTPALNGNKSLDTFASSAKPLIPAGYKSGESAFDYALIRLNTPIGTKQFRELQNAALCHWGSATCGAATVMNPIETRALLGKTAHSAGYPKNKGGSSMLRVSGMLHSAETKRQLIWYTGAASEGQSGSPVWIREGNLYCLAGVLVAEGRSSSAVVPLTRDMAAQLRTWMDESKAREFEYEDEGDVYQAEEELNPRSRVDKSTAQWIQTALSKSRRLAPLLGQKLSTISVATNFVHHGSDAEFNHAYMKFRKIVVPFDSPEYKAVNVRGFFDRANGAIHLRPQANLGEAVRFAIQKYSSPALAKVLGPTVGEGVGLYLANVLLTEQGMPSIAAGDRAVALTCATHLAGVVGEAAVGKAYFHDPTDVVNALRTKLSIGPVTLDEIMNDKLCKTTLLPTARFASYSLTNMVAVGITGPRWVRLWMRSAVAGPHEVKIVGPDGARLLTLTIRDGAEDKTAAVTYPQTNAHRPLVPLTKYRYWVTRTADKTIIGEGSFETPPASDADTPEKVVIALWSCHQPFANDGTIESESARMLRLLPKILKDNDVKFVLPCGDQIYADDPDAFNLFKNKYLVRQSVPNPKKPDAPKRIEECTEAELRRIYNTRYRTFWSSHSLREMYANYPSYPTLDDHEIRGDWGSLPEPASPALQRLKNGALAAYFDYQAKSVLPPMAKPPDSFHYDFSYGNIGVFVMDIRTQRAVGTRTPLFGDVQLNDFRLFLGNNVRKKVLLIVASVPVVHLGRLLTDFGADVFNPVTGLSIDFPDQWSYRKNIPARDAFLSLLYAHQQKNPNQRIALLGGDVHIGNAFGIQWKNGPSFYQFTASPLSALLRGIKADLSTLGPRLLRGIDVRDPKTGRVVAEGRARLLPGIAKRDRNPLVGLNLGLIEIQRTGGVSKIKFKLVGHHPNEDRPVTHFESDWLG